MMVTPCLMNHDLNLKHAKHNEAACNYLKQSGKFNDWVVTTAFYSAIHFIQYELFPQHYDIPGRSKAKNFHRFDDYYDCVKKDFNYSKHKVLQDLVEEYVPEISDDYQVLKDNCWNARYIDYKIENEIVELCIRALSNIKELCDEIPKK